MEQHFLPKAIFYILWNMLNRNLFYVSCHINLRILDNNKETMVWIASKKCHFIFFFPHFYLRQSLVILPVEFWWDSVNEWFVIFGKNIKNHSIFRNMSRPALFNDSTHIMLRKRYVFIDYVYGLKLIKIFQ